MVNIGNNEDTHDDATEHRPRRRIRLVNKLSWLRLDVFTLLRMLKGGLPPIIVIAMYQATSIAQIEYTLGYLAAILTVSAQCLLPRAKFIKIMFFSVFATCIGAALSCVAVICCVRARQSSNPSDTYDSSASVVSAVWLIFGIWLANAFRAHRLSELQDPMVALSIFLVVALTSTPSFVTVSEGLQFVRRLLVTFLIGLSVATGVSLLILPITSRRNVFRALDSYTKAVDGLFDAQIAFVKKEANMTADIMGGYDGRRNGAVTRKQNPREKLIATKLSDLGEILSKMDAELIYTKIEIAWGKLTPDDFIQIHNHLSTLFLALAGLSMLPEISQTMDEVTSMREKPLNPSHSAASMIGDTDEAPIWQNMVDSLEKRLLSTRELVASGLRAAFNLLEIKLSDIGGRQQTSSSLDLEQQETRPAMHCSDPSGFFYKEMVKYKDRKQNLHQIWPSLMFPTQADSIVSENELDAWHGDLEVREHLLVFLFMEQLQNEALQAVNNLLNFAESKVRTNAMRHNRLIIPSYRHFDFIIPLANTIHRHNLHEKRSYTVPRPRPSKDAEHLFPNNWWERSGSHLRVLPKMLTSPESKFGARVAMASLSVAILAYIRQTHTWFTEERVIWVMIVIVIGMKPESGASTFGYLARIGGTTISMILSFIVWYIVDGHTAGVLVFLYFANVLEYYFWVRFPQFLGPSTIMIVTLNVIIAYELQVKKLGIEEATSNGQPFLPIYTFGPYKLLCVIIAVTISFFWTLFPSPVSARSQVRRNLGQALFLLANFYGCMHQSVKLWINEQQGDLHDPKSMGRRLQALNKTLFSRQVALTTQNLSLIHWTSYEIPLGGKFPKQAYKSALSNVRMLTTCMALMTHATRDIATSMPAFGSGDNPEALRSGSDPNAVKEEKWIHQLAQATKSADFDAHTTTSVLCHLAGAISTNSELPPYLSPPKSFLLALKVREMNAQAMHIDNIHHPEFLAFATMEVAASLINKTLGRLIEDVKDLVGEIDFDIDTRDEHAKSRNIKSQ